MKVIYKNKKFDPENQSYGTSMAITPVFDSTDHMHFACGQCKEITTTLLVYRDDSYANTPTIYFLMRCPKCGKCGIRKIYLEDCGKHFMVFPSKVELLAKTPEEAKAGIRKRP